MAENAESERSTDMKNEIWSEISDYSGQLAHALKRVQRMGSAV